MLLPIAAQSEKPAEVRTRQVSWRDFKPGSFIVHRSTRTEMTLVGAGEPSVDESRTTLREVTPDGCVLQNVRTKDGKEFSRSEGISPYESSAPTKPKERPQVGEERLTIGDAEYPCKIVLSRLPSGRTGRLWINDQVGQLRVIWDEPESHTSERVDAFGVPIAVGDRTFSCTQRTLTSVDSNGSLMTVQYRCPEVPGSIVRVRIWEATTGGPPSSKFEQDIVECHLIPAEAVK